MINTDSKSEDWNGKKVEPFCQIFIMKTGHNIQVLSVFCCLVICRVGSGGFLVWLLYNRLVSQRCSLSVASKLKLILWLSPFINGYLLPLNICIYLKKNSFLFFVFFHILTCTATVLSKISMPTLVVSRHQVTPFEVIRATFICKYLYFIYSVRDYKWQTQQIIANKKKILRGNWKVLSIIIQN